VPWQLANSRHSAKSFFYTGSLKVAEQIKCFGQWVETNPSNIRIFPMDIRFLLPRGTMVKVLKQMFVNVR
jgi:hypothetical protein